MTTARNAPPKGATQREDAGITNVTCGTFVIPKPLAATIPFLVICFGFCFTVFAKQTDPPTKKLEAIVLDDPSVEKDWMYEGVRLVAFAPDGKSLLSVHRNARIRYWDVPQRKLTKTVILGQLPIGRPVISGDSELLVFATWRTLESRGCFPDRAINSIAWSTGEADALSPDTRTIGITDGWGKVSVVNRINGRKSDLFHSKNSEPPILSFSRDQQLLFAAAETNIQCFDLQQKKILRSISLEADRSVESVSQSCSGESLLVGCQLYGVDTDVRHLGFPPDSAKLLRIRTTLGGELQVWDKSLSKVLVRKTHSSGICIIALSPTKRFFAIAGYDGTITLCRAGDCKQLAYFDFHKEWPVYLAISRNGKMIASGYRDNKILVWATGIND